MNTADFENWVLSGDNSENVTREFPQVYSDHDGDRLEFVLSDEDRIADRIDHRLTVYRGRESGEIVGGSIKGLAGLGSRLLAEFDGFAFCISEGKANLALIFAAAALKQSDQVLAMHYQSVFDRLSMTRIEVAVNAEPEQANGASDLCNA